MLLASTGWAISDLEPASILVYPYFNSDADNGYASLITVTNVNPLQVYDPDTDTLEGDVFVKFYYVNATDCDITDRDTYLTPADTITVLASDHNPATDQGWLYVVAMDPWSKLFGIKHDGQILIAPPDIFFNSGLIGDIMIANGLTNHLWSIPAIGIKAKGKVVGELADKNKNRILEFGTEYEGLPSTLFISSFLEMGIGAGKFNSNAYLILLTFLPVEYTVFMDFLFYNNDEEEFSQEFQFNCYFNDLMTEVFASADNITGPTGKSNHYDEDAVVQTLWASMRVEKARAFGDTLPWNCVPILGAILQTIFDTHYQSARLLHHSCDEYVSGELEY